VLQLDYHSKPDCVYIIRLNILVKGALKLQWTKKRILLLYLSK